jgi:hypothetical protein
MAIDVATETLLSLPQAARRLPPGRNGRPCHPATLFRWIHAGARRPSGERVYLDGARLGNRWLTSAEALQRFSDALTPPVASTDLRPTPRTPLARRRASEQAGRKLDRIGI